MTEKIRALIVDDEPLAREGLRLLLQGDPQIEIVGECASGREAMRALRKAHPELLFLDVQMPEMDGFETLARAGIELPPVVIFVTAYEAYAVQAFEAQALDYLLKPFSDERFAVALARAKEQIEQKRFREEKRGARSGEGGVPAAPGEIRDQASPGIERLLIKAGARISFLEVGEIDWIEAADYYVLLHVGKRSHLLRESLTQLEAKLDPRRFARIHRSTIVNIERVKELGARASGDYAVILCDGTVLKLSRRRREKLRLLLKRS